MNVGDLVMGCTRPLGEAVCESGFMCHGVHVQALSGSVGGPKLLSFLGVDVVAPVGGAGLLPSSARPWLTCSQFHMRTILHCLQDP